MLQDRVAIVTGSTRGIGKAIALNLASKGAKILITSNEPELFPETLAEVQKFSQDSDVFEADVTSKESLEGMIKFAQERFGKIDILVNNAGITRDGLLMRMKDEDWDLVMSINLRSIFRLTRQVMRPMMKARYGRIINIASVVGYTGNAGQANYTTAKAGLVAFTKTVAQEVASRGITANCVAPGFIQTAMTDKLNPKAREAILSQIPMGSMGQPEDVADAVAFLASDQAGYMTGQTLHVNGGMLMT
ncbi:MAG: 3-oxoacyl-[acyl-carrier-protein] reductase [Magnetococcales bacterium]|nr:3-oxoacyl-[acyl-carrier-protein] reductase [Magnetococcales bacterium]